MNPLVRGRTGRMPIVDYPYRPKPLALALASAFFVATGAVMAHLAATNDRALVLSGIHLSMANTTRFYAVATVACALFVAIGLASIVAGWHSRHRLVVTPTTMSAPRSAFSRLPTVVPIASIVDLDVTVVHHQRLLTVRHRAGKLVVAQSLLPDKAAFDAVVHALLALRARAEHEGQSDSSNEDHR